MSTTKPGNGYASAVLNELKRQLQYDKTLAQNAWQCSTFFKLLFNIHLINTIATVNDRYHVVQQTNDLGFCPNC